MRREVPVLSGCSLFLASFGAMAASLLIPADTVLFGQLDEEITSNTRKFRVGFEPYGHVWKDVVVAGITVIEAGTPLELRISRLEPRGVVGRGANIEIMALSVEAVDGTEITLRGGYGERTQNRSGITNIVGAFLWPARLVPGKRAKLEEGLVFDMEIPTATYIEVPDDAVPTLVLTTTSGLSVEIDYNDFALREGEVPLDIRLCEYNWTNDVEVTAVNDRKISPLPVTVTGRRFIDGCDVADGSVDLDDLTKHFDRGINRFTVRVGDQVGEVVLNVEM